MRRSLDCRPGETVHEAWWRNTRAGYDRQLYRGRRNMKDAAEHERAAFIAAAGARENASFARKLARQIKGRNGAVAMIEARRAGHHASNAHTYARMIQRERERMAQNGAWSRYARYSLTRSFVENARRSQQRSRAAARFVIALAVESGMHPAGVVFVAVRQGKAA